MMGGPTASREPWTEQRRLIADRVNVYKAENGYNNYEADECLGVPRGSINALLATNTVVGSKKLNAIKDALDHGFNRTAPFDEAAARTALDHYMAQRRKRQGETG